MPPSALSSAAGASVRFGPAAPAVGVSRRDKNCRKRTYSHVETQKPEHHTNTTTDWVMNDDPVEAAEDRSKAGQAGLDMGQWCRM